MEHARLDRNEGKATLVEIKRGPSPITTITTETLRRVYDFLPHDARIVPGHGVPITRDALQWHISYLAAVRAQVQIAIDQGLTLEQTVKQVALPEFAGYALFGWVHPMLNVPAAYKDLSKK